MAALGVTHKLPNQARKRRSWSFGAYGRHAIVCLYGMRTVKSDSVHERAIAGKARAVVDGL